MTPSPLVLLTAILAITQTPTHSLFLASALTAPREGRSAVKAERYAYDSFGSPTITGPGPDGQMDTADDVTLPESALGNPYLFTGREYDPESGLYYHRGRYRDPRTGRFLQEDPVGHMAGPNFYAYADNNPVNWVDPYGYSPWLVKRVGQTGLKKIAQVSRDAARRLFRKDKRDILGSKNFAKKVAKTGRRAIGPERSKGGYPHFHDSERSGGHAFFNSVAGGIGVGGVVGSDANEAEAADLVTCATEPTESQPTPKEGERSNVITTLTAVLDFILEPETAE